jgi:hypothetical protein
VARPERAPRWTFQAGALGDQLGRHLAHRAGEHVHDLSVLRRGPKIALTHGRARPRSVGGPWHGCGYVERGVRRPDGDRVEEWKSSEATARQGFTDKVKEAPAEGYAYVRLEHDGVVVQSWPDA